MDAGLVKEAVSDTAGAAAYIRKNELKGCAAIASRQAAKNYNLEILADSIQVLFFFFFFLESGHRTFRQACLHAWLNP